MEKLYIWILFIACAANLSAQDNFKFLVSDDDFKKKISEESVSLKSLESTFTQNKHTSLLSGDIVSKGVFYYKKDNKICLDYTSPVKYLIVINGKKIKIAADGKTTVYDAGKDKMMSQVTTLMSSCITGDFDKLASEYTLTFKENAAQYRIEVLPKTESQSRMKSMDIFINKKDFSVQRLKMTESSNDYTEYVFTNSKKNVAIPDTKFSIK
jgi:outer membrane lipoprotein-sorting protein